MGVMAGVYGQKEVTYKGCVLYTYEHNGYDDSDWYAVCWDHEQQKVVEVEYDTTMAAGGGWATVDATEEVLREVYRFYKNRSRIQFDTVRNEMQAREIKVGDTVEIVRGRKIPQGTVATVFWKGNVRNFYTDKVETRIGIEYDGKREFVHESYAQVIDWQSRLIHGKQRKQYIRNFALNSLPTEYRKHFIENFSKIKC